MGTILFFCLLVVIYKYSQPENRWWVGFFIFICVLTKCGYEVSTFGLILWVAIAKLVKDLCRK
jgi:hypothetical protein